MAVQFPVVPCSSSTWLLIQGEISGSQVPFSECAPCSSSSRCVSSRSAHNHPWAGGIATPCTSVGELAGNARVWDSSTSDSKAWLSSAPINSVPTPNVGTRFSSFSVLSGPCHLLPKGKAFSTLSTRRVQYESHLSTFFIANDRNSTQIGLRQKKKKKTNSNLIGSNRESPGLQPWLWGNGSGRRVGWGGQLQVLQEPQGCQDSFHSIFQISFLCVGFTDKQSLPVLHCDGF